MGSKNQCNIIVQSSLDVLSLWIPFAKAATSDIAAMAAIAFLIVENFRASSIKF